MKITKQSLLEIIKEETAAITEGKLKEDVEGDADEAFIQSSQLGQADAEADEAADRNSEEDEGYQANRRNADSDKDYVRAYEAERRKGAIVLKDPPDIKRMKQGLKRVSRPRSAGDDRSDKERFENP